MTNIFLRILSIALITLAISGCATKKSTTNTVTTDKTARDSINKTQDVVTSNNVGKIQTVNPQQFKKLLLLDEIQLVDVRTSEEFNAGHIEDAINIDVNQSNFKTKVSRLDKSKPVLVYCRSGKRSDNAAEILKEMGFTKIVALEGGMISWEAANLPINK